MLANFKCNKKVYLLTKISAIFHKTRFGFLNFPVILPHQKSSKYEYKRIYSSTHLNKAYVFKEL
ncbi:hypothetical protein NCWK1_2679 [Nostoc cycadae WK-1]|uniref:Uncharacterized protein n=1 Tax=Nostoc cycadae WK-1 TaxID=1861711 RepID=A0A2H6LI73_9NOSO|nr:hypothetical protein NCWK1_2679 [Nostoc cycadae WK-1]